MNEHEEVYTQCRIETSNRLTKIETLLASQKTTLEKIYEQTKLTNARVTKLEMWRESVIGKVAGIAAAISAIMGVVALIIHIVLK